METYKYKKTIDRDIFATRIDNTIDKERYIKELFVDYSKVYIVISDKEEFEDIEWMNKDFWNYSLRNYSPAFIGTTQEFLDRRIIPINERDCSIIIYLNVENKKLFDLLAKYRSLSHQEVIYSSLKDIEDKQLLELIDNNLIENTTKLFFNLTKEKLEIVRNGEPEKNVLEVSSFDDYILLVDWFHGVYQDRLYTQKKHKLIIYSSELKLLESFRVGAGIYEKRYKDSLIKINEIKQFGYKSNMIWCEV